MWLKCLYEWKNKDSEKISNNDDDLSISAKGSRINTVPLDVNEKMFEKAISWISIVCVSPEKGGPFKCDGSCE